MDCAFDDDRTIVVAMVDFAKTATLVFYIVINYLLLNLSPPTVLIVELPNFNNSFLMVSPIQIVLRMTIEPLWSPWWTSQKPPIWSSI